MAKAAPPTPCPDPVVAPRAALGSQDCSRVISGGWQLSSGHHSGFDRAAALRGARAGHARGLTSLDMGDIYTGVETLVGEFLRRCDGGGAAVQAHTKFVPDLDLIRSGGVNEHVVECMVRRSCNRLGLQRLDLVQFHWWDFDCGGYVDAAKALAAHPAVAQFGLTNFDALHMAELQDAGLEVVSNQVQYSVLDRRPEAALVPLCQATGAVLLPYGVLAGGFLTDRWLGAPDPLDAELGEVEELSMESLTDFSKLPTRSHTKYYLIIRQSGGWARFQRLLRILRGIADRHGTTIAVVAAAWVLSRPAVGAIILGSRSEKHLDATMSIFELRLSAQDLAEIDAHEREYNPPQLPEHPLGAVYGLERRFDSRHASIMRFNLGLYATATHRLEVHDRAIALLESVLEGPNLLEGQRNGAALLPGMMDTSELARNTLCEIRAMLHLDSSGDLVPLRAAFDVATALAKLDHADGSRECSGLWSPFVATELLKFDAEVAAARAVVDGGKRAAQAEADQQAKVLTELGMQQFKQHRLPAALAYFDAVLLADPSRAALMWQRGLCLFYLGRFPEAAAQFARDVAANAADSEEAIWHCLSTVRGGSTLEQARAAMPEVEPDPRPLLRAALRLFRGEAGVGELLRARDEGAPDSAAHDFFYCELYAGLFLEAAGAADEAAARIRRACGSEYAAAASSQTPGQTHAGRDLMVDVALLHQALSGPSCTGAAR